MDDIDFPGNVKICSYPGGALLGKRLLTGHILKFDSVSNIEIYNIWVTGNHHLQSLADLYGENYYVPKAHGTQVGLMFSHDNGGNTNNIIISGVKAFDFALDAIWFPHSENYPEKIAMNVIIEKCEVYSSGYGITLENVENICIRNSRVYGCGWYINNEYGGWNIRIAGTYPSRFVVLEKVEIDGYCPIRGYKVGRFGLTANGTGIKKRIFLRNVNISNIPMWGMFAQGHELIIDNLYTSNNGADIDFTNSYGIINNIEFETYTGTLDLTKFIIL